MGINRLLLDTISTSTSPPAGSYYLYASSSGNPKWVGSDGVFSSVGSKLDQSVSTGAVEVLTLTQADVDQNMIKFVGTSSTATADQSLVNAAHFATPGSVAGWIQITVQDDSTSTGALTDGHYWVPVYATPT